MNHWQKFNTGFVSGRKCESCGKRVASHWIGLLLLVFVPVLAIPFRGWLTLHLWERLGLLLALYLVAALVLFWFVPLARRAT